jgi:hypothetical protein
MKATLIVTDVVFASAITGAYAQDTTSDTVKTRLGDLKFEQGYPTEETKRKVFDEIDYQRCRADIPVGLSGGARAVD